MLDAKPLRNARITAACTADKSYLALEMNHAGSPSLRVLLSLAEAKELFCDVDLAVADMESARKPATGPARGTARSSSKPFRS